MNASARAHPEPVDRFRPATGSELSAALLPAIERVREWAGDGLRSLIVSGSHASGEAVWAELEGRRVSLSDLDLYAVMRDAAACAAARARAAAGRGGLAREALALGLVAPVEVAFVTFEGLVRMPTRPGTVELARSGRVLWGDGTVLERLPRWDPAAVPAEERLLLLENRAFELLWAAGEMRRSGRPGGSGGSGGANAASASDIALPALLARHAVLKTALDLAAVRTLAHGELPVGAAARVARARELGAPAHPPSWLEGAWEGLETLWLEALAWRDGTARAPAADAAAVEWHAAARAWSTVWWAEREAVRAPRDPWQRALGAAARAPLARRVRRAFGALAGGDVAGGALARLRHALAGTPQHRIHGSATVLVLAAAQSPHEPRLPAGALRALRHLGVARGPEFATAAAGVVRAWDRGLHAGLRTADAP